MRTSTRKNSIVAILSFVCISVLILAFQSANHEGVNEYLIINIEGDRDFQEITISTSAGGLKKIMYLDPERPGNYNFRYKSAVRRGCEIRETSLSDFENNQIIFNLLSNYEKEGWLINSHSIAMAGYDDITDTRISQYLFTRKQIK